MAETIERVTPETLRARKAMGVRLAALTAYDYPTARLIDRAGLDLILVGDSLGALLLGHDRIEATTLDEMIQHCWAVSRGARRALVVGDMPFSSYKITPVEAVEHAVRLVKKGGVGAVRVEGGMEVAPMVRALVAASIPVIGHLAPSHAASDAATPEARRASLVEAALALEEAGACAFVLVGLDAGDAAAITRALTTAPTLGYHSGLECDGRLLVAPFLLGLLPADEPQPGPYGALGAQLFETFQRFRTHAYAGGATGDSQQEDDAARRGG